MKELTVEELQHPNLSDRVYQIIREGIERQEFEPGLRLIDNEVAARLGVSRTPVRDAIGKLAVDGLVTITPRRGVFVSSLSAKDVEDTYQVREVLEILAIQLAIRRFHDQDLADLTKNLEEYQVAQEKDDHAAYFELDRQFHDHLIEKSGNRKLAEINKNLGGIIQLTRWMNCENRGKSDLSLREHRLIRDALTDRDVDLACGHMQDHIRRVKTELLEYLNSPTRTELEPSDLLK